MRRPGLMNNAQYQILQHPAAAATGAHNGMSYTPKMHAVDETDPEKYVQNIGEILEQHFDTARHLRQRRALGNFSRGFNPGVNASSDIFRWMRFGGDAVEARDAHRVVAGGGIGDCAAVLDETVNGLNVNDPSTGAPKLFEDPGRSGERHQLSDYLRGYAFSLMSVLKAHENAAPDTMRDAVSVLNKQFFSKVKKLLLNEFEFADKNQPYTDFAGVFDGVAQGTNGLGPGGGHNARDLMSAYGKMVNSQSDTTLDRLMVQKNASEYMDMYNNHVYGNLVYANAYHGANGAGGRGGFICNVGDLYRDNRATVFTTAMEEHVDGYFRTLRGVGNLTPRELEVYKVFEERLYESKGFPSMNKIVATLSKVQHMVLDDFRYVVHGQVTHPNGASRVDPNAPDVKRALSEQLLQDSEELVKAHYKVQSAMQAMAQKRHDNPLPGCPANEFRQHAPNSLKYGFTISDIPYEDGNGSVYATVNTMQHEFIDYFRDTIRANPDQHAYEHISFMGKCGSGKSYLTNLLKEAKYNVIVLNHPVNAHQFQEIQAQIEDLGQDDYVYVILDDVSKVADSYADHGEEYSTEALKLIKAKVRTDGVKPTYLHFSVTVRLPEILATRAMIDPNDRHADDNLKHLMNTQWSDDPNISVKNDVRHHDSAKENFVELLLSGSAFLPTAPADQYRHSALYMPELNEDLITSLMNELQADSNNGVHRRGLANKKFYYLDDKSKNPAHIERYNGVMGGLFPPPPALPAPINFVGGFDDPRIVALTGGARGVGNYSADDQRAITRVIGMYNAEVVGAGDLGTLSDLKDRVGELLYQGLPGKAYKLEFDAHGGVTANSGLQNDYGAVQQTLVASTQDAANVTYLMGSDNYYGRNYPDKGERIKRFAVGSLSGDFNACSESAVVQFLGRKRSAGLTATPPSVELEFLTHDGSQNKNTVKDTLAKLDEAAKYRYYIKKSVKPLWYDLFGISSDKVEKYDPDPTSDANQRYNNYLKFKVDFVEFCERPENISLLNGYLSGTEPNADRLFLKAFQQEFGDVTKLEENSGKYRFQGGKELPIKAFAGELINSAIVYGKWHQLEIGQSAGNDNYKKMSMDANASIAQVRRAVMDSCPLMNGNLKKDQTRIVDDIKNYAMSANKSKYFLADSTYYRIAQHGNALNVNTTATANTGIGKVSRDIVTTVMDPNRGNIARDALKRLRDQLDTSFSQSGSEIHKHKMGLVKGLDDLGRKLDEIANGNAKAIAERVANLNTTDRGYGDSMVVSVVGDKVVVVFTDSDEHRLDDPDSLVDRLKNLGGGTKVDQTHDVDAVVRKFTLTLDDEALLNKKPSSLGDSLFGLFVGGVVQVVDNDRDDVDSNASTDLDNDDLDDDLDELDDVADHDLDRPGGRNFREQLRYRRRDGKDGGDRQDGGQMQKMKVEAEVSSAIEAGRFNQKTLDMVEKSGGMAVNGIPALILAIDKECDGMFVKDMLNLDCVRAGQTYKGFNALHLAVAKGNLGAANAILSNSPKLAKKADSKGNLPIEYATDNAEMRDLLKKYGAKDKGNTNTVTYTVGAEPEIQTKEKVTRTEFGARHKTAAAVAVTSGISSGLLLAGAFSFSFAAPLALFTIALTVGGMAFAVPSVQKEQVQTQKGQAQGKMQSVELPKVPTVDLHVSKLNAKEKAKALMDTSREIH